MKRHFMFLSLVTSCMLLFGCGGVDPEDPQGPGNPDTEEPDDPNDPDDPDDPDTPDGGSISGSNGPVTIGYQAGDSGTLNIVFGGDWEVKSTSDWFTATPDKGSKGAVRIKIEATETNTSTDGRVGEIVLASGTNQKSWKVVQLGTKGFIITDQVKTYTSQLCKVTIKMRANTDAFTFSQDGGMIDSYDIKFSGGYDEIEDSGAFTDYRDATLTITLKKNPEMDAEREQTFTISAGTESDQITVIQPGGRWDNPFYRRSLVLKFTSTGCQFCPFMDDAITDAVNSYPDRIIPVSCYSSDLGGKIVWDMTPYLAGKYNVYSYPTGIFNSIAQLKHSSENATIIKSLAEEATESYPAHTTAAATSTLTGSTVKVDVTITSRTKGTYQLHVWVAENKVIESQSSSQSTIQNYEHNHIGRGMLTARDGDSFTIDARSSKTMSVSGTLPAEIKNKDNAYLVIFVTYPGNPTTKGVNLASYKNYGSIVDNVYSMPLNGSFDLRYED